MPALVQFKANVIFSGETFVQVTFDSPVTGGNTLVVHGTMYLGPTISDTRGHTWTLLPSEAGYYCLNAIAGTDTVKFQFASAPGWGTICASEWTKASSGNGPDVYTNSATGTGTTATSGSLTPTVANELAIGFVSGGGNPVAAGGATQVDNTTTDLVEYIVKATTAAFTMTATLPSSSTWYFSVDTFKPLTTQTLSTTCTDSINLTSSVQRAIGKTRSDTLSLVSTISRAIGKNPTDTLTLTSSLTRAIGKSPTDSLTLISSLSRAIGKPISSTLALTESITRSLSRASSDSLSLSETRTANLGGSIASTLTLTDIPTVRSLARSCAETLALTEALAFVRGKGVIISDTLTLADSLASSLAHRCVDGLTLADSALRELARLAVDSLPLFDSTRHALSAATADAITPVDSSQRSLGATLLDSLTFLDTVLGLLIGDLGKYARKLVAEVLLRRWFAEDEPPLVIATPVIRLWSAEQNSMIYADPKDPESLEDFQIDWAPVIGTDTISASTWEVPDDLVALANSHAGTVTTVRLSGGIAGRRYTIKNLVTLSSGEIRAQSILLPVK
jgi:hypothetical protein